MEIDQIKFMNLVMEKTNKRLNEMLAQVIVLESQLQLVADLNKELQEQLLKEKEIKNSIGLTGIAFENFSGVFLTRKTINIHLITI